MELVTRAKVQKKSDSAVWVNDVPQKIHGKTDVSFQTMDGRLKFSQMDSEYAGQFVTGEEYEITCTFSPETDKYGNLFFKPSDISNFEKL